MYPGSWKLKIIEVSDFCGFFCIRGHESWRKLKCRSFVDFHVPGVMKVEENQSVGFLCTPGFMKIEENRSVWFLWIFMYPGSWKLNRIKASDFCGFSCTQGHENWIESKRLFLWTCMYPGSWKLKKIEVSDFCGFSCTRGHENWRKSKCLIFVDFHVTSFYLITQKWWLITSKTMYKHFKGQKPVPWWPKIEPIKNLSPPVVMSGIKKLMLRVSLQSDHR